MEKNTHEKNCKIRNFLDKAKPNCKKIVSSKIFIAIVFTLLGVCGTVLAKSKDNQEMVESFPTWPDSYDKEFGAIFNDNIFSEMHQMQRRMDKIFSDHQEYMAKTFAESKKNNATRTSVAQKEDDDNYYYELNFAGFKKDDVVVSLKDDILTFSAAKKSDEKAKEQYASNFYYSFSVPQRNEKTEPQIIKEDNKVIVKLAK
ncbi:MAG: Hsp20/alpha crystallin family protein [Rickettsiales bacterium]|nr:Hsp20/alpha crystallin family protein [Rickettsiales bacterium]